MIEDAKLVERFLAKVDLRPDSEEVYPGIGGCWLWTSTIFQGSGYAGFWLGKLTLAHRVAYRLYYGGISKDAAVRHRCDVRRCVNPSHLDEGSLSQNTQDMYDRNRRPGWVPPRASENATKTHCKRGHLLSGANLIIVKTNGARACRECRNDRQRAAYPERYARQKAERAAHQNADPGCP